MCLWAHILWYSLLSSDSDQESYGAGRPFAKPGIKSWVSAHRASALLAIPAAAYLLCYPSGLYVIIKFHIDIIIFKKIINTLAITIFHLCVLYSISVFLNERVSEPSLHFTFLVSISQMSPFILSLTSPLYIFTFCSTVLMITFWCVHMMVLRNEKQHILDCDLPLTISVNYPFYSPLSF